jgi:hypothetical protein
MKRGILLVLSLLLAAGCERTGYSTYSTRYKVFFSCETGVSPYNQLNTPGRFLSIRKTEGKLIITDSDGKKYDQTLSAVENGSFLMGQAGLILGTPYFDNDDMSIWAYDLACPYCDNPYCRLKFDYQGIATCPNCESTWNLNSSGIPVESTGDQNRRLYRYPTSFNNGILTVSN